MAVLLASLLLAGCSSIPEPIRKAPPSNPSLVEVRSAPERFQGEEVRWGGTIAGVENLEEQTVLEVVARDLDSSGQPRRRDASAGRFLAMVDGFIDPAIYAVDREITVVGAITGSQRRKLGSMNYLYPEVHVEHHYLWPVREPECWDCDPFYRDPWYPYGYPYPYYPWPYYPHYH